MLILLYGGHLENASAFCYLLACLVTIQMLDNGEFFKIEILTKIIVILRFL